MPPRRGAPDGAPLHVDVVERRIGPQIADRGLHVLDGGGERGLAGEAIADRGHHIAPLRQARQHHRPVGIGAGSARPAAGPAAPVHEHHERPRPLLGKARRGQEQVHLQGAIAVQGGVGQVGKAGHPAGEGHGVLRQGVRPHLGHGGPHGGPVGQHLPEAGGRRNRCGGGGDGQGADPGEHGDQSAHPEPSPSWCKAVAIWVPPGPMPEHGMLQTAPQHKTNQFVHFVARDATGGGSQGREARIRPRIRRKSAGDCPTSARKAREK